MDSATAAQPATPGNERSTSVGSLIDRHFSLIASALGLASGLLVFLVARTSAFVDDDFLNIGEARSQGLSLELLFHPVTDVHLQPVHRFFNWLLVASGTSVSAAAAIEAVWFALAVFLAALAVRAISRSAPLAIGCCFLLATSIVALRVSLWWTEAIGEFPALAVTFGLMLAAIAWGRARTTPLLILNGLLAVGVVLSFDKYLTVFLPVIAVLVVGLSDDRGASAEDLRRRIRHSLPLIVIYTAVAGTYLVAALVAVLTRANPFGASRFPTGPSAWAEYLLKWWDYGVSGAMTNTTPGTDSPVFLGLLVLAVLAAATIRGRRAALLWVVAIVTIFANAVILGIGRLGSAGLILVIDPRFHDLTLLTLILLVPAAWRASGSPWPKTTPAKAIGAAIAVVLAAVWLVNGKAALVEQRAVTRVDIAGSYAKNIRATLTPLARTHSDLTLLDELAPVELVGYKGAAYTETGSVARTLVPNVDFTVDSPDGTVVRVASSGRAGVAKVGKASDFRLPAQACIRSAADSTWNGPGAGSLSIALPDDLKAQGKRTLLLVTVRISGSNSRGGIGLGLKGADGRLYRYASQRLSTHPRGIAAPSPAADPIHVLLWDGASACVEGVSAGPID